MIEVPIQRLLNWRLCENLLVLHHVWLASITYYYFYYTCYLMYLLSTAALLWSLRRISLDPAACFDQSVGFPNPTVCRPSSQGKKSCDKMSRKSWDNNASWSWESKFCNNAAAAWPFDPHYYEKPRHATGIVMKTSDILNWAEVFTVRILLLSSYLRYSESSERLVF